MTIDNVSDISPRIQYTASNGQTAFDYPFPIFQNSDLVVLKNSFTQLLNTDFTVTGAGNDTGGTVTLVVAAALNDVITITRKLVIERTSALQPTSAISSELLNTDLDRLTLIAQDLDNSFDRTLQLSIDDTTDTTLVPFTLPVKTARANKFLFCDVNGLITGVNGTGADTTLRSDLSAGVQGTALSGAVKFDRTAAEITASVTPSDYSYPPQRIAGNVKRYGCVCDGTTDDTAAFQRAVDSVGSKGGYLFVPGDMKLTSQILIRLKTGLTIELEQFAQITFTDGAYVGFLFSGGGGHILRGGRIYGSNHGATPLITLVQFGEASSPNQCPNALVEGVTFSYASKCVYLASTYETTCRNNLYANSDQAIVAGGLGSCTDIQLIGETFGNCTLGTNYVVQISSNGTRITDCYWETTTNTKGCLIIKTGAQYATITGGIAVTSGEFKVEPSNNVAVAGLSMQDCYDSVNLRTWRVDGSSNVKFSGCQLGFAAVVSNVTGILASGSVRVTGCDFIKCFNGVQLGPDSTVLGNGFLSCTTGVTALSSMRVAENTFSSCGTGINVGSSLAAIGKNYYDTCGTNITDATAGAAQVNEATKGTGTNVTDGATVAHTHPKTPRRVFAQSTVAGEFVSVTAIGASTFTVAIKKHDGTAGTSQTIYWETSG